MAHTAAITRKATRRKNDAYFTPVHAVDCLYEHVNLSGRILEPCAGIGAISNYLTSLGFKVAATDIDQDPEHDATTETYWDSAGEGYDWVVTNPPFNHASKIVPLAYAHARVGIAFLLRLSYLEPCTDRGQWLADHPPSNIVIMPRISFTGDGKVDTKAYTECLINQVTEKSPIRGLGDSLFEKAFT